jgi:hypothetical protein
VLSGPFKTLSRCNILNIHGGLHLYKTADYEIEKRPATAAGMIDAIVTISQGDRFPVYVAEGTSSAKLSRINEVLSLHLQAKRRQPRGNEWQAFIFPEIEWVAD